ncbi:hypothetical protein MHB65_24865 [Lysinibacillus sp. FSL K6-0075]|uniref:hypothetical protein n=1 Tax=Lysinibacillus sp. FSL K6-0075 TaxID=2921415 RepID=UPI003158132B
MFQKLRTLTQTNGTIKQLDAGYEQLNIRGAVSLHQEVHLKKVSTHGHSSFYYPVTAQVFNSTGSCVLKDYCEIEELTNAGNIKIRNGLIQKINSSGKLMVEGELQSEQFDAIGIVKAAEIIAHHFHLKLSGESEIGRLMAENVIIEKDKMTLLPLFKKMLRCHTVSGKHLQFSNTKAEFVEGEVVQVGENCVIGTLSYTDDYSIASSAKVHHIIRREKEWHS